nr:immunoglobulin light chain junction region [Macaca mulatta]MOW36958.1 immunoglobulin light chain junction region [Macaca mulatta]MOW37887.1 immunoglobulin light chain junction region [Macaca mulatta]MOW38540.1 immunoglobulin light chain junction region [Macaca mulatta]
DYYCQVWDSSCTQWVF